MFSKTQIKLIGFIILCALAALYSYYVKDDVEKQDLIVFEEKLAAKPYTGSHGGEFDYKYIVLSLSFGELILDNCSYKEVDRNLTLSLNTGDTVRIGVLDKKNGETIYSLYSKKFGDLLELSVYNDCSQNEWVILYRLALVLMVIFLGTIIFRAFKPH